MISKGFEKSGMTIPKMLPPVLLAVAFFSLIVPLTLKPEIPIYDSYDESYFHYPTVLAFVDQFPHLDLVHYHSATGPFYHILLSSIAFFLGSGIIQLRLVNVVISLTCLLLVYWYLSERGGLLKGLFFATIFMLSPYFIGPASRLSTDNMALLLALSSIMMMDIRVSLGTKSSFLTNLLIALTILTRQIYAWLIGAFFILNYQRHKDRGPMSNLGAWLLPAFIPIVGLGYFLFLWKGLTPPLFTDYTARTVNWGAPIFIVSLVGLYGSFFFLEMFEVYKKNVGKLKFPILLTALSAGYLLLHPVSNQYQGIGARGGALWLAASHLPNLFNSSLLYWFLFPIGTVCLYIMIQELVLNRSYVMVICFSLWFLTSLVNARTYQKFYEPFILFFLGYTMIPLMSERWFYWVGPAILLAGFIAVTFIRFF